VIAALGVVYGDIGTSPLYAVRQSLVNLGDMSEHAILDTISLIVWALMLVATVKYVLVIIRADNRGEGGLLALTALALRSTSSREDGIFGSWQPAWSLLPLFYGDGVTRVALGPTGLAAILTPNAVHMSTSAVSPPVRGTSPRSMHPTVRTMPPLRCSGSGRRSATEALRARGGVAAGDAEGPSAPGAAWLTGIRHRRRACIGAPPQARCQCAHRDDVECMGEVLALMRKGGPTAISHLRSHQLPLRLAGP
jgi:hypothetical protein